MHLLNRRATLLWARYHHPHPRPAADALADWLTAEQGVPPRSQVAACLAEWRAAGLLDLPPPDAGPWTAPWVIPPPAPAPLASAEQALAGLTLGLRIDDPTLAARAVPLVAPLRQPQARQRTHALYLAGTPDDWPVLTAAGYCW